MADAAEPKIDTAKAEVVAEQAAAVEAPAPAAEAAPAPKADAKVARKVAPKVAKPVKAPAAKKAAAPKTAPRAPKAAKAAKAAPATPLKDTIMAKTKTAAEDFTAKVQETVAEAQDRAKAAFEKGQALFGDAGEFTKGNVEALVESGKILASGLQTMGKDYVTEGKTAFETVQADIKELAAVKSPADFFKLQGEIMRRNFDAVVTAGSKHSEAVLKLTNDAFAPVSTRVSLAIEKVKKAA